MGNLLSEVHPELIEQWSERNLPLTPDKITYGSNKIVWWKGACGHEWQTSIKARSNGENCPICSGARVVEGINDLATLKPELAAEWSSKNKTLKPTMVSVGSHKKVIWKGKCGHEWSATVKSRATNGTGCPYCSHNKILVGFNDLASQRPQIASEWSERNYPLKPDMVTVFANRKVWWRCSKGHEWNTLISTRSGGSGCPYCSGQLLLKGFNDFATTHPQLAQEWSDRNLPLTPDMINEKSRRNVWWKCRECGYKQFPQASQIKEFDDWAAEGVKVNKGSKTFIILDPYEYTKKDGTIGIDFNLKRVLDVSQTNGKRPAAPTANRDPRKLVAVMLDSAPINIESTNELPYPDMGAFYKNEDQTLYVKRDIGDSVALCQCVAQELGHAELSMNSEVYSRRDMGFQAVCIGYMLCKKYGVDTQNFAIDRIPDELKNKEPKDIKAELGKTQKAFKEITARVSDELYRQRAERSKEQER